MKKKSIQPYVLNAALHACESWTGETGSAVLPNNVENRTERKRIERGGSTSDGHNKQQALETEVT